VVGLLMRYVVGVVQQIAKNKRY
ncbi:lipocalin-like domain protein, partial [Vibrio cholerae O1 str. EDC-020]